MKIKQKRRKNKLETTAMAYDRGYVAGVAAAFFAFGTAIVLLCILLTIFGVKI